MFVSDCDRMAQGAVGKYELANKMPATYFMRAIMAGFLLVSANIFSNVTGAVFYKTFPEFGKFFGAIAFSMGIILIVFIGGELFTGNNMVMAMGAFKKKVTWGNVMKVWIYSYIGNLIGSVIFGLIFYFSGACRDMLREYWAASIPAKLELSAMEMLLKGALCNFMVCLAVLTGFRMKSESGRLIVMFLVITTFIISGFEHSIANMGTFTIAWPLLGGLSVAGLIKSFVFVTLGNIIGGAVLLAWPLKVMSQPD